MVGQYNRCHGQNSNMYLQNPKLRLRVTLCSVLPKRKVCDAEALSQLNSAVTP
jgi:hypothetical protein